MVKLPYFVYLLATKILVKCKEFNMDEEKSDPLELTVKEALDMFRPQLQADGGDMEYISIDDQNRVHLRLIGACGGCPMATMTIKMGIERYLKDAVPEITEVVQEI